MKKLTFLALVSLAALTAFVLIGTRTHRPAPSLPAVVEPVGTPVSLAPPASPAPVDPMKSYRWVVGDHGVWALQTSLRLGAVEDEQAAQLTSVSGTLELTVLAAASEEVRLLAMLHQPQCQSAGVAMPALDALCDRTACVITLDPQGRLLRLAFPAAVAEEDRKFLKLVFGWPGQMVAEPRSQYVEPEPDADGIAASYARRGDTIVKTRFSNTTNAVPNYQAIISSRFTGRLGHLWLSSLEGAEDSEMVVNQQPFIRGTIWVKLQELPAAAPSAALRTWLGQVPALTSRAAPGAASVGAELRREALAERWGAVPLADVAGEFKPGAGMEEHVGALKHMREWLQVHGVEGVNQLLAAVAAPELGEELAGLMTHALATSDGEMAHQGHLVILNNPASFPESVLNQALVSAGQQEEPAPDLIASVSTLLDKHEDPNSVALLAAASLARQDPVLAETLKSRVLPDLAEGAPADRVERSLMALGQAEIRDPAVQAAAERWEQSTDPDVRVAAVKYLYRVADDPTQIEEQYRSDPDARIRGLFASAAGAE